MSIPFGEYGFEGQSNANRNERHGPQSPGNKISELIHEPVHYNGVPTCSYSVGSVTVERTAAITCEDSEAWQRLLPFFREKGWIQEPVDEPDDVEETETMETVTMNTEMQTPEATGVNIPLNDFTAIGVANLLRLLYTRQDLINAMTRSDRLCIDEEVMNLLEDKQEATMEDILAMLQSETDIGMVKGMAISEGRLTVDFVFDSERPTDWTHYAKLMAALVEKADHAHHVSKKRITPEDIEMKYFCNTFLNQLGFGGAEHKELRSVLMAHLHGFAAFRSADKIWKHTRPSTIACAEKRERAR